MIVYIPGHCLFQLQPVENISGPPNTLSNVNCFYRQTTHRPFIRTKCTFFAIDWQLLSYSSFCAVSERGRMNSAISACA